MIWLQIMMVSYRQAKYLYMLPELLSSNMDNTKLHGKSISQFFGLSLTSVQETLMSEDS